MLDSVANLVSAILPDPLDLDVTQTLARVLANLASRLERVINVPLDSMVSLDRAVAVSTCHCSHQFS